jgi:hypothetical protein
MGRLGNGTQTGSYVPINIALPGEPVVSNITTAEDTMSDLLKIKRHPEDDPETAYMRDYAGRGWTAVQSRWYDCRRRWQLFAGERNRAGLAVLAGTPISMVSVPGSSSPSLD